MKFKYLIICFVLLGTGCQKAKILSVNEDATLRIYGNVKECTEEVFRADIQFGDTVPGELIGKRVINFDKEGRELYYYISALSPYKGMLMDWTSCPFYAIDYPDTSRNTTMISYDYNEYGLIIREKINSIKPECRIRIVKQYNYSDRQYLESKTTIRYDTLRSIFGEHNSPEKYDTTYGYYIYYDSTSYKYDNKGNLLKEWSYSKEGDTVKLDYMKRYQYDSKNREVLGAEYNSDGTLNHSWEISYFPDGSYSLRDSSVLLKEESGLCDYYRYIKEYKYNPMGQLIYRYKNSHYNKGHFTGNRLNCRNNAFYKEKLQYTNSGKLSSVEAYEYDLRAQDFKDESWIIKFEYDQDNHLIRVDKPRFLPWYVMQDDCYKSLTHIEPSPNILQKDKYNWTEEISHSEKPITITKRTISYWK